MCWSNHSDNQSFGRPEPERLRCKTNELIRMQMHKHANMRTICAHTRIDNDLSQNPNEHGNTCTYVHIRAHGTSASDYQQHAFGSDSRIRTSGQHREISVPQTNWLLNRRFLSIYDLDAIHASTVSANIHPLLSRWPCFECNLPFHVSTHAQNTHALFLYRECMAAIRPTTGFCCVIAAVRVIDFAQRTHALHPYV